MNKDIEKRREIVARYLRESASAEHSGPEMVKMGLLATKAKAREDGKLEIALSTEDRDRHKDILRSSGAALGAFRKNPVLLFAHMHTRPAVGKVTGVKKGKRDKDGVGEITGLVEFAPTPLGQELRLLYEGGFMKAFSVGFIPEKWDRIEDENGEPDKEGGVDVKKWELLEVSAVPVPANPAALSRCDMSAFQGGTEEEVVEAMKAFREAAEPEEPLLPPIPEQECTFCGELFNGAPGLCTYHTSLLARDMVEPANDIAESFEEALEELRAKITSGTWEPEGVACDDDSEWIKSAFIFVHEDGTAKLFKQVADDQTISVDFETFAEAVEANEDAVIVFKGDAIEAPFEPAPEVDMKATDENYKSIPFKSYPKQDPGTRWDEGPVRRAADVDDLKRIATVFLKAEPENKGSYKLIHHQVDNRTNLRACQAAIGVLNGARGGMKPVPSASVRKALWNHLARHVREFDKEPAELRSIEDVEAGTITFEDTERMLDHVYDMTSAMEDLREASEGTLTVLEKIMAIKAEMDLEPEPIEPAAPGEPAEPVEPVEPEPEPEKGLTRDEALKLMKDALTGIGEEIKKTTERTIRAEMGRAVDFD